MFAFETLKLNIRLNDSTTLTDLLDLGLHEFEEDVKHTVDKAVKEMQMEKLLHDIEMQWIAMEFDYEPHNGAGIQMMKASELMIEKLEENQMQIQNMATSKYVAYFESAINDWTQKLATIDAIIMTWTEVQRKWLYLESIFFGSEDIRMQLPDDSKRFHDLNELFHAILTRIMATRNALSLAGQPRLLAQMEQVLAGLILCEKALNGYLETKRLIYPRFYFISSVDLLDILSNSGEPAIVCRHLTKLYDSIKQLKYRPNTKHAVGMYSKEHNEYVAFSEQCDCSGKVELWLNELTRTMRLTLKQLFARALDAYPIKPRDKWIFEWPAQVALCITQIYWSIEMHAIFQRIEDGYENGLKDYQRKQISQLTALISLLLGELSGGDRQKIMTVCTIDVHSRDVVAKMIAQKVTTAASFQFQSQLRHHWNHAAQDCYVQICDAEFKYDYEYLGISPRLVVTPLTDRCYITLTQVGYYERFAGGLRLFRKSARLFVVFAGSLSNLTYSFSLTDCSLFI